MRLGTGTVAQRYGSGTVLGSASAVLSGIAELKSRKRFDFYYCHTVCRYCVQPYADIRCMRIRIYEEDIKYNKSNEKI